MTATPAKPTVSEIIERLDKCHRMIGKMCSESRPPKMQIPAAHDEYNEDIYICDTLRMVKAILTSQPAGEPGGWRDIETAPKDGTEILVYRKDAGVFTAHFVAPSDLIGTDDDEPAWFTIHGEDLTSDMPTRWQPLPLPPKA